MAEKDLITVVCTANICRSPMAAALLQHALKAEAEPLCRLRVASAGVLAYNGEPASLNSIRALKSVGLEIGDHRSQALSPEIIRASFALFVMTQSHRLMIQTQSAEALPEIFLFREFMPPEAGVEIPDPFGQDLSAYEACRDSMVEAIPPIVQWLRQNYPHKPAS